MKIEQVTNRTLSHCVSLLKGFATGVYKEDSLEEADWLIFGYNERDEHDDDTGLEIPFHQPDNRVVWFTRGRNCHRVPTFDWLRFGSERRHVLAHTFHDHFVTDVKKGSFDNDEEVFYHTLNQDTCDWIAQHSEDERPKALDLETALAETRAVLEKLPVAEQDYFHSVFDALKTTPYYNELDCEHLDEWKDSYASYHSTNRCWARSFFLGKRFRALEEVNTLLGLDNSRLGVLAHMMFGLQKRDNDFLNWPDAKQGLRSLYVDTYMEILSELKRRVQSEVTFNHKGVPEVECQDDEKDSQSKKRRWLL